MTTQIFHEYTDAIRAGRTPVRIVVPTATLVRHYRHELARSGLVIDPATVVSLSRFAQDCAPGLTLASAGLLRALIRAALTRLDLPAFAGVAATEGMTDVVLETIALFENADCTPERLSNIRGLTSQGKAFLRIWKEVDAALAARGLATRGQIFRQATQAAPAYAQIWLDGFLNLSPLERRFVRALNAKAEVTLTLTDSPATDELRRFAMELGAADRLLPGAPRRPLAIAVQAPSPEREADEIARRIVELRATGTPFPDIAVAIRDVDTWLPLLRIAFDRFGIPARYYFSEPVRNHPVATFLGGIVSAALGGWDFESSLTALRAHPAWGHTAGFDGFDFAVREAMPHRGAEALLALCKPEWLKSRIAECIKIDAWRGQLARPAVWRRRLEDFAASVYRVGTIPEPTDYAALETARTHAAALRAWSAALDTAVGLWSPGTEIPLADFHSIVVAELNTAGTSVPDDRTEVVHVMSAFEARQWEVRTLIVCGMSARDYPRRHSRNLLFSDSDIAQLRGQGIHVRSAADEDRDEEQLFALLRTRASESLILTASSHNAGGQTIELSRHFTEVPVILRSEVCRPAAVCAPPPAGAAGNIVEASLPGLAEQHRTVGLTALESLAKCRFRFFADRTLRLKEPPELPGERLSFSRIGLIFHEAMEIWIADRTQDYVELFERVFDDTCRRHNIPSGYRLEVERIQQRRIAREVNASVRWPAERTETEVVCDFTLPGGVTVNCRVDRIDHVGNGDCVIVDYKSGKVANVDKLIESETSLQGPLYGLAVREKMGLNPVAMVFLAIREGKLLGWGAVPGADLELNAMPPDWIDAARDRTVIRLQSFLSGDVHAEPSTPDDCVWCDFKHACRIEERVEESEEPDEIVQIAGVTHAN